MRGGVCRHSASKIHDLKFIPPRPGAFRTSFAADALKYMPAMEAHRNIVGGTRDFTRGMHGTQDDDPHKAARERPRAPSRRNRRRSPDRCHQQR
jgi:hypothetical protein